MHRCIYKRSCSRQKLIKKAPEESANTSTICMQQRQTKCNGNSITATGHQGNSFSHIQSTITHRWNHSFGHFPAGVPAWRKSLQTSSYIFIWQIMNHIYQSTDRKWMYYTLQKQSMSTHTATDKKACMVTCDRNIINQHWLMHCLLYVRLPVRHALFHAHTMAFSVAGLHAWNDLPSGL